MGAPWRLSSAWTVVEQAEEALEQPLAHLLLDPQGEGLERTRDAQMAVFLSSLLAWEELRSRIDAPVAFAGHSLGQITALVASSALSIRDGAVLALRRADCTQAAADQRPGAMAALLGATVEQAQLACASGVPGADGRPSCWVANDNGPGQVVIGGTPDGVEAAVANARGLGVRRAVALKVAAAFHTPLMADAAMALRVHLASVRFDRPSAPVVCNTDAQAHGDSDWADRLATHLTSPVRWRESVSTLAQHGADEFYELGPGGVLAGLVKRCRPDSMVSGIAGPDDLPEPLLVAGSTFGRTI